MKRNRALFDAVTQIDEDWIDEAATPRVLTFPKPLRRIAAIAAAFAILITALAFWPADENYVTGPGLFVVRAHAVDDQGNMIQESEVLQVGIEFTSTVRYEFKSHRARYTFSFSVDENYFSDMQLTAEVMINAGIFEGKPYDVSEFLKYSKENEDKPLLYVDARQLVMPRYGQHFTVETDRALIWSPYGFDYDYMVQEIEKGNTDGSAAYKPLNYEHSPSFIDVIFRADDKIVGYCVIAIYETSKEEEYPTREFTFELLTMVSFPQVNGRFQTVSIDYVNKQIRHYHKIAEKGGE